MSDDPILNVQALGLTFPTPLGVAAGVDKDGSWFSNLAALGFGCIEVGTVTAQAQAGNPRPRIARVIGDRALINWMGFPNPGAPAVAERLAHRPPGVVVGINVGKSRAAPLEDAVADYRESVRRLAPVADYIALNVSSPNTPGLRDLQGAAALSELLRTIASENRQNPKPVLVKIAPDLSPNDLEDLIATCEQNEVAGIIATNTTLDHSSIPPARDREGGLSGKPLREKSTALVRAITARSTIPVVASGGVVDAESAREKFEAGAQLVQIYTGYIYRGPGLLREITKTLQ